MIGLVAGLFTNMHKQAGYHIIAWQVRYAQAALSFQILSYLPLALALVTLVYS